MPILPAALFATAGQVSPIRAADPCGRLLQRADLSPLVRNRRPLQILLIDFGSVTGRSVSAP